MHDVVWKRKFTNTRFPWFRLRTDLCVWVVLLSSANRPSMWRTSSGQDDYKGLRYLINVIKSSIYLPHKRWALKFCHLLRATWVSLTSKQQQKTSGIKLLNHKNAVSNDRMNCCSITVQILWPVWDWANQYFMDSIICLLPLSGFKIASFERNPVSCRLLAQTVFSGDWCEG